MKHILFLLLGLILIVSMADAEVYIVYDKDTKDIVSISNEDDCVVQEGMELKVFKDKNLSDITIVKKPIYYKLQDNKIVPNMEKIAQQEQAEIEQYVYDQEELDIKKYIKNKAIDELEKDGKEFKKNHKK